MNFMVTWLFDKLGYMPKIDIQVGKLNVEAAWPFPEEKPKSKPAAKKTTTRKVPVKKAK
jgi:hypothetical protein